MLNSISVPAPVASPHVQLFTDALGALAPSDAVVATDAQPEQTPLSLISAEIASLCMAESTSYRGTSKRVDFVPQHRMQVAWRALRHDVGTALGYWSELDPLGNSQRLSGLITEDAFGEIPRISAPSSV